MGRGEEPVADGEVVDGQSEEVVGHGPFGGLSRGGADEGAVAGEVLHQDAEAAAGEAASVPVEEVDAVVAEEIRFQGFGVLLDEGAEAQPSPTVRPVSWP